MKNDINFCLFPMILKNSQVAIYWWIETFFDLLANVELTDSSQFFFMSRFFWAFIDRTKESFDSLTNYNLRVFQNHRKQAKINVVFHHFPSLGLNVNAWFCIFKIRHFFPWYSWLKVGLLDVSCSWANVDVFQKFKIIVVCLDLTMEKDEKQH